MAELDLSGLSAQEQQALAAGDMSALSDSTLKALAAKDWNLADSSKSFGSGAVEGTAGLFGLLGDLGIGNKLPDLNFTMSKQIQSFLDPYLAEKDPQYRYARTLGNFAGPTAAGGALGAALKGLGVLPEAVTAAPAAARTIGSVALKYGEPILRDTLAGLGAQVAEDVTGDKKIAPLAGSIFASTLPSLFKNGATILKSLLLGASDAEKTGTAAQVMKDMTDLTPEQIQEAIAAAPVDDLGKYMTTAEVTENAGMGQIEKTMANSGKAQAQYSARVKDREALRQSILDAENMSTVPATNKEGLGTQLMTAAEDTQKQMGQRAKSLWDNVPRDEEINILPEQEILEGIFTRRQKGLPVNSKVNLLVKQFMSGMDSNAEVLTSGGLQDIRSDALMLLRDANITPHESDILVALQNGIDNAMEHGLKGDSYTTWKAARDTTRTKAETFKRGTAGGSLTEETARPSNVLANAFKGDAQSVNELKAAVASNPSVIEDVKRGIIESIPKDAQGNLTPNKMKNFLLANEGGLKELFGEEQWSLMHRVLDDLRSEADVAPNAFLSSKGNSTTAQKATVAGVIENMMVSGVNPGGTWVGKILNALKEGAGIKDKAAVQELLVRAAMEPSFAAELAAAPTTTRIFNAMERLGKIANDAFNAAGNSAARELSRTESNVETPKTPGKSAKIALDLQKAMVAQESGGRADAVSEVGALGVMQLMPATAKQVADEMGLKDYDLTDPTTNKKMGTYYMAKLLNQFDNDPELALTAYHSGPGRVAALVAKTKAYLEKDSVTLADIIANQDAMKLSTKEKLGPIGQVYAAQTLARLAPSTPKTTAEV